MTVQTLYFNELDQAVRPEDAVKMVRLTLDDNGRVMSSLVAYAEPKAMTEVGTSKSGSYGHTGRPGHVGGQGPTLKSLGQGEEYPEHLKGKIPPGWTNVEVDEDKDANMWVRARDSKGRLVYIYNPKYLQSLQDQKFSKTDELYGQYQEVYNENSANYSKNPNESDCTKLIMETGVRPGSTADTLADQQAYGATTLEGRHIVVDTDGKVSLQFVAKEGISQNLPVDDPVTAKMLVDRAEKAGPTGKIFKTSSGKLLDYTHTLGGSGFNVKDIRTVVGTRTAVQELAKYPKPTNLKEYKLLVKNVSTAVSKKLGNTPSMSLKYYISPWVWDEVKVIK
jgi:DNA topoisomerase-1